MKKLFFTLMIFLLTVCLAIPVLAIETDTKTIDVRAKYVCNLPWNTATPDGDGEAKITLPDGRMVSVSGIQDNRWTLVVDVITEPKTLEYLDRVVEKDLTDRLHLHIFFLDENHAVRNAKGAVILVQSMKETTNPAVYALSDGALERVPASADRSTLHFTATDDTVYVLGTSQTGCEGNFILWLFVLLISMGCVCVIVVVIIRRNFYKNKK